MQIELRVDGEQHDDELRSLHAWLKQDRDGRGSSELSLVERSAGPGAMGGMLDVVQLVTGNVWSAASFTISLVTWRQTRPRSPQVTVRRGDAEVVLTNASEAEVQRIVELLSRELPAGISEQE
ncbi:hypothetical protein LN042_32980 [Kitasatospora sp. RB6PN24]|uniref:effector-associated constant component EACC1 n=1 Tax=Kitasatospora humi TaxID=2893891 RepID=UPI001E38AEC7|nr:hypothetical protein [Kitasatospora humi]MCC9311824.1 hypothetical protein [Kitasatospora humi]